MTFAHADAGDRGDRSSALGRCQVDRLAPGSLVSTWHSPCESAKHRQDRIRQVRKVAGDIDRQEDRTERGRCATTATRDDGPRPTGRTGAPPACPTAATGRHQEEGTLAKATAHATKLRPLGDRVVIQPSAREEMTKSGIVLPDTAKEKPQEGTIIAAGPGRILEDGKREAMDVKTGDKVLYAKYAGTEFKVDGDELLIVSQKDILAIVAD